VKAAVDPHYGLAFRGQRVRLVVGQVPGPPQALGDFLVSRQVLQVRGRSDNRHRDRPVFGRLADIHQLDPVGFFSQLVPIVQQLGVVGEKVIVANGLATHFRRSDCRLSACAKASG
jgi:hypothetical protein